MCFSVFASASALVAGLVGSLVAWVAVAHSRLDPGRRAYYRNAIVWWTFANGMQLADLLSWTSINAGGESRWNGPLAFVLNTGQIPAAALAVSLAAGSVAPPVAAAVAPYVAGVAYIAATTPLTVSPKRPGGRLVYSWWHSQRGFALAMVYLVAMAFCTREYPEPLRSAMFAGQFGTLAMAAASPSAQMPEVASVWCWAAAVGGPLSVMAALRAEA